MNKYFYAIRRFKIKPWLKYWILNKEKTSSGVLSEILSGTSFTLENSLDRLFNKFDLKGNTLQDGTPTPDSPIPIQNVSGNNTIKVQNRNLLDATNYKENTNYYYSDNLISSSEAMIMSFRDKDTSVDISGCYIGFTDDYEGIGNPVQYRWIINNGEVRDNKTNLSVINNTTLCKQWFVYPKTALATLLARYDIQIELGSTSTDYIAHAEQNLPVNLGEYELCKIGTAQDYFYKENSKWYIHKEIGDETLDGTNQKINNIGTASNLYYVLYPLPEGKNALQNLNLLSNRFVGGYLSLGKFYISSAVENTVVFVHTDQSLDTVAKWNTWLQSNNTRIQYQLATPTNTEITETSLINQLEAILQARSYNEQTNISQTNEDLPFIIDLQYWMKEGV